jgi:nitrogen fixation protein NifB
MKKVDPIKEKIKEHPCFCEKAHTKFARIHLPVAPKCNIQCNYCSRKYDCANESRPGVTSKVIAPEEALEVFIKYKKILENLTVVGIAGPGDPLANPYKTFKTFELIRNFDNNIKLCLSTNGLELHRFTYEIKFFKIDHITITINTIDEKIGNAVYSYIRYKNTIIKGEEAAKILIGNQLEALKLLSQMGIITKINTVLIPGINDANISMVAKMIKKNGCFIHNIVPLINPNDKSTKFSKNGIRQPSDEELAFARLESAMEFGGMSSIMHHCKQCRSDAVGLLGENSTIDYNGIEQSEGSDEKLCANKNNCR